MDEKGFKDVLFKKKLAQPYLNFTHNNFQKPLNQTKNDFWSTLKQTTPQDEEINRTPEIKKKYDI